MVLYFAYGSNMLTARLQARCPSAVPVAVARADGYAFIYGKRGQDGSAKATLVPRDGETAYGVLFEISEKDLAALDGFEGRGRGYERDDNFVAIKLSNGEPVTACTYLAPEEFIDRSLQPFDWYQALVLAGATEHGLPGHYVADRVGSKQDAFRDRSTDRSVEAVQILEKAGFSGLL
jgi:gamma-glutamylcyclotransferase